MARTETIERTFYQFDELDDDAKETARNWWRSCVDSDDWQAVARILGISFQDCHVAGRAIVRPQIYWTLNPDSAAFAGRYVYAKQAPKRIREYAPKDAVLHGIADRLAMIQRRNFYQLVADCETSGRDGTTQRVTVYRNHGGYNELIDSDDLAECLTDFAHWIACQVSAQWDYLNSDEYIDESIRINEYEFDENGNIA